MILEKLLRQISTSLVTTEVGQQELEKYRQMQKSEGWKVYQRLVVSVANELAKYLLSKEFTEQDERTKDREQTALYMAKSFFDFLLDPLTLAGRAAAIRQHNLKMEETLKKGSTKRKGKV